MNSSFLSVATASSVSLIFGCLAQAQDAEIFLELPEIQVERMLAESEPPERIDAELYIGTEFEGQSFYTEQPEASPVFEHRLARWKDPLTLPKSRMECVKWASGDWPWPASGGWKTCVGHAYQWQWMYVTAHLKVHMKTPQDIANQVQECLSSGAVAGVLAGAVDAFLTGGVTAFETAKVTAVTVISSCLTDKLGEELVTANIETSSRWGDWE